MQFIFPLLFFALTVGLAVYRAKKQNDPLARMQEWPYRQRDTLLSPEETAFYQALRRYLDPALIVCPKVRLDSVVYAPPESRITFALVAKMRDRYLDFAVCEAETLRPLCAVKFNDNAAPQPNAQEQAEVERILRSAAVPLFSYQPQYQYQAADFRQINELYCHNA